MFKQLQNTLFSTSGLVLLAYFVSEMAGLVGLAPLTAWVSPALLIWFYRQNFNRWGFLTAWLTISAVNLIGMPGLVPMPQPFLSVFAFVVSLFFMLPLSVSVWLNQSIKGWLGTFVLPVVFVAWQFQDSLTSPFGSWGSVYYTQVAFTPLFQTTSVFGMWLVIFLLYWWAAVVNLAWEKQWNIYKLQSAVGSFAAVLILSLLFGFGRVAMASTSETVTIAAIAPSSAQYLQAMGNSGNMQNIITGNMTPADSETFQQGMAPLTVELLSQTETAAQNGAKIIFWAEGSTMILAEDEAAFQSQAQALSQQYGVYIGLAYATIQPAGAKHHNKVVLIDPAGNIALEYLKTKLVPFAEDIYFEPGTGDVPVVDTPYGRLAMAICHDLDHHEFVQQLGEKEVDILLVPTGDWADIAQVHLDMMATRAVEQGLTIVRATRGGYSAVVAPTGEVLATKDNADARFNGTLVNPPYPAVTSVLLASAPQEGVATPYRAIGDGFALANVLVLIGFVGLALYNRFGKTKA